MNYLATILAGTLIICNGAVLQGADQTRPSAASSQSIVWSSSYDQALAQAQSNGKPVLLFFTGSDWCSWCHKLEKEVFNTSDFINLARDKYNFVKIDFPKRTSLPKQITAQNQQLKNQYQVKRFPTVVLIDGQQHMIGFAGYMPGGGTAYANHLDSMVTKYRKYKQSSQAVGKDKLSFEELKQLYETAQELNDAEIALAIANEGVANDKDRYFLFEKYRQLVTNGSPSNREVAAVRQQIYGSAEPAQQAHYKVAVIDFQANLDRVPPDEAVKPLVTYLNQYGEDDPDNSWKIEMTIAQAFFDAQDYRSALPHAETALRLAPAQAKSDIKKVIAEIKNRL